MFRQNTRHLQMSLTSHVDERLEPLHKRLQNLWAESFYFDPYLKGHAGQYAYRLKQEELGEHLQPIGEQMQRLRGELVEQYGQEAGYAVLAWVFVEHFRLEQEKLRVKSHRELSAVSLQSPDDLEASYREKGGKGHRGYVVKVAETCEQDNPVQLITAVQAAPNHTDDSVLSIAGTVSRPESAT